MKLTEILLCIAIFFIASTIFMESLINVERNVSKSEQALKTMSSVLATDMLLRQKMRMIDIPYWKRFRNEYEQEKEKLLIFAAENNIKLVSVSPIYDEKYKAEGIRIEWVYDGKDYVTQEYIKQRIIDEE